MLDVQLQYLEPPCMLEYDYNYENEEVTLSWQFADLDNPEFTNFNVYMSVNGINYNYIAECTETTYYRPLMPIISIYYAVDAEYINGNSVKCDPVQVEFTPADDDQVTPLATTLHTNYPNPFNPSTTIKFDLSQSSPVNLSIYNTRGQLVKTLISGTKTAGSYSYVWDGTNDQSETQASGVYFYKLHYKNKQIIKKMMMMK